MEKNMNTIKVIIVKEMIDSFKTLKLILLFGIICFNICIYATETKIFELGMDKKTLSLQLGTSMIYLVSMSILFLGSALVNKLIYEEKKNKTIHMLLSMGLSQTIVWYGKMLAIIIMCEIYSLITLVTHIIFIKIVLGCGLKFTFLSAVMTFVTLPMLCFGFLCVISIGFMYFSKMNFVGMFIQIIPYLAIWEISGRLIKYVTLPGIVAILSMLIGCVLILISGFCVSKIPKEKIVSRVD